MHKVTPIIQRSPSNSHEEWMKMVSCSFLSIAVMQHSTRSYYTAFTYYSAASSKGCHAAFFDKLPHRIHQVPCCHQPRICSAEFMKMIPSSINQVTSTSMQHPSWIQCSLQHTEVSMQNHQKLPWAHTKYSYLSWSIGVTRKATMQHSSCIHSPISWYAASIYGYYAACTI